MIRDNEVVQAIGRLRGVNRKTPAKVTLVSDALTDYTVDPIELKPEIRVAGILGPMLERGVVFLSAAQAAKAYPDLYASKQAAQKVFGAVSDWATFPIRTLHGKGCPVVEIKTPRSKSTTKALVAPWIENTPAEIKKHLPSATVAKIDSPELEGQPAPVNNDDAQKSVPDVTALAAHAIRLADADGVARTPEAIEAVWDWAEALARNEAGPSKIPR